MAFFYYIISAIYIKANYWPEREVGSFLSNQP